MAFSIYKTICDLFPIWTAQPAQDKEGAVKLFINFENIADALEHIAERAGTKIYYGQIAGTSGGSDEAVNGDYFLDTEDGKLYIKSSGSWVEVVTLKGTNGTDGSNGTNGTNGVGITEATVNASGHLILTYSNSTTADCGNVAGADGADGSAGWTDTSNATAAPELTFTDGSRVNLTNSAITTISVDLATGADCAAFMFLAGSSAPSIDDPVDAEANPLWDWLGDDCADGVFSPVALTEYSCVIEATPRGVKVYVGRI